MKKTTEKIFNLRISLKMEKTPRDLHNGNIFYEAKIFWNLETYHSFKSIKSIFFWKKNLLTDSMIIKKIKAFQRKKGGGENYGVGFKKKKKENLLVLFYHSNYWCKATLWA